MDSIITKLNGVHPGAVLKRELKKRGIKPIDLASEIGEHKQTISAILNERRGINANLSVKLAQFFSIDPSFYMHLQAAYEVNCILEKQRSNNNTPNLLVIRKVLFWDTNFDNMNWVSKKSAVIKRIFERGNEAEIQEIIGFYGKETVEKTISKYQNDFIAKFKENVLKYEENTLGSD
jgi:addiction module HigA family antidote